MALRGFEKKDPMAGLNQLLQMMNQMGQMQERKQKPIRTRLQDFSENISSTFDNNSINSEIKRLNNYYNNNRNNMSSESIDEYNYILSKANDVIKDNTLYNSQMQEIDVYNDDVISKLNAYNNSSEEEKNQISKDIENTMIKYISSKNSIFKKFGNRLALPQYAQDTRKLEAIDDIYLFGINSLKDDGKYTEDERNTFSNAIIQGKVDVIDDYVKKESKAKNTAASFNLELGVRELESKNSKLVFLNKLNEIN